MDKIGEKEYNLSGRGKSGGRCLNAPLGLNQWFINLKYFFVLRTKFWTRVTQEKVLFGLRKEKPWFT